MGHDDPSAALPAPDPLSAQLRASSRDHRTLLSVLVGLALAGYVAGHVHEQTFYSAVRWTVLAAVGAPVVFVAAYARSPRVLVPGLLLGAAVASAYAVLLSRVTDVPGFFECVGAAGFGTTAFVGARAARTAGAPKQDALDVFRASLAIALVTPASIQILFETIWVFPKSWDSVACALDTALPLQSFQVGRFLGRSPALTAVAGLVYDGIFAFLPVLYGLQIRRRTALPSDLLVVVALVSVLGQIGYYLTPIVGPRIAFAALFPNTLPDPSALSWAEMVALPAPRNCMPSVHTALALVFFWNTRRMHRAVRAFGAFVVAFTVLSTLGFGHHYVIDLVAAVPFAAAVQAGCTHVGAEHLGTRRASVLGCAAIAVLATLAPRLVPREALALPGLVSFAAISTVLVGLFLEYRVARVASPRPVPNDAVAPRAPSALFACSGFVAGLVLAPVAEGLGASFGDGSAVPLVTACFAVALTAVLSTTIANPATALLRNNTLPAALLAASLSALWLAALMPRSAWLFGRLVEGASQGSLRVAISAGVIAVLVALPSSFAGALASRCPSRVAAGIALGLLASSYVLVPSLGVSDALVVAVALGLVLALVAYFSERRAPSRLDALPTSKPRRVALVAGSVVAANQTVAHVLSIAAAGSAHPFVLVVAPLCASVALGAALSRLLADRGVHSKLVERASLSLLAAFALILPSLLARVAPHLGSLGGYEMARRFADREWLRVLAWTAFCVPWGAFATLALLASDGSPGGTSAGSGTTAALLGASAGYFAVSSLVGSLGVSALLGLSLALAVAGALSAPSRAVRLAVAAGAGSLVALATRFPTASLLVVGGDAFTARRPSTIEGGLRVAFGRLVAVEERGNHVVVTSNGIVVATSDPGDDEVALVAAALSQAGSVDHALRIGYGAADAVAEIRARSSATIDVVESDAVVRASAGPRFSGFPKTGEGARTLLSRRPTPYGFISVAATSPARSGATVFSKNFYALVRENLAPGGVFEQELDWPRLRDGELLQVVASIRGEFPELRVFLHGDKAGIVACVASCSPVAVANGVVTLLLPNGVDRWLASRTTNPSALAASDDDLRLADTLPGASFDPALGRTTRGELAPFGPGSR